jgi:hypothetical protein
VKPIRWTAHAEARLPDREIDRAEADHTIQPPDCEIPGRFGRTIRVRRYGDAVLGQPMALRVLAETGAAETVVITLYKSSNLAKSLEGGTS